mgnify:CR=1 FL=1
MIHFFTGRAGSGKSTAVIEAITKKKVDPKYETFIHTAGLMLLLLFMIFIMFNDILRIFTR